MNIQIREDKVKLEIECNRYLEEKFEELEGYKEEECWIFHISKLDELDQLLEDKKTKKERLEELSNYLIKKNYSKKTIKNYVGHMKRYLEYSTNYISLESINDYILNVLKEKDSSASYCNQAISAIKLYTRISNKIPETDIVDIIRPKKKKKLPIVLSKEEVKKYLIYA